MTTPDIRFRFAVDPGNVVPESQKVSEALKKIGQAGEVSAAQTAAALRTLPAQFTDIVTSLQGGQSLSTVILQQGGQIKDSFGGVGAAARALGGYVLGLVNPLTVAAAAAGVAALAYAKGAAESDAYAKALILSGNAAGTTAGQLQASARAISSVVGTTGTAAEALAQLAGASNIDGANIERFALVTVKAERSIGIAAAETIKRFSELGGAPLDASLKLNKQTNFLTVSVYQQIKALEESGRTADAARVAQTAWADALEQRGAALEQRLGSIEKGWRGIKDIAKGAWDAMLDLGREKTLQEKLADADKRIADLRQQRETNLRGNAGKRGSTFDAEIAAETQRANALRTAIGLENSAAAAAAAVASKVAARVEWDKLAEGSLTNQEKLTRAIAQANNLADASGASAAERARVIADLRAKFKTPTADPFASDREAAKSWADAVMDFGRLAEEASSQTDGLSKAQARLVEYLKSPAYSVGTESMRQLALQRAYDAIEAERQADAARVTAATIADFTKITEKATAQTEGLSDGQARLIQYLQSPAYALATEDKRQFVLQGAYVAIAAEKEAAGHKLVAQTVKEAHDAHLKLIAGLDKSAASIAEQVQRLQDEESAAYIAAAQEITLAQAIARVEIARLRERQVAMLGNEEAVAALQREIDARMKLADLTDGKARREASDKALKAEQEAWGKAWDQIGQTVTDALQRAFESGKDFGRSLLDTIKSTFKTSVIRLAIQPLLTSTGAAAAGLFGMPAQAAGLGGAAGGSGSLSALGSLASLSSGAGSIFSAGSSLAMGGATGQALGWSGEMLAGGNILGGLSAGAGALAPWAGALMAGGAIGRSIGGGRGLFGSSGNGLVNAGMLAGAVLGGPIGAAIGGAAAGVINRAFGTGPREVKDGGITGRLGGAGGTQLSAFEAWSKKGGWFRSGSSGTDTRALDADTASTLSDAVLALQTSTRGYAQAIGLSAASVDTYSQDIRLSLQGLDAQAQQDAINKALGTFGDGLATSLGSAIAALGAKGETAAQTLARLATSITTVNGTLDTLGMALLATSTSGADAASKLLDQFGGAAAFGQQTSAYYQTFYSEQERIATTARQLANTFGTLGVALPKTRAEYRKLVEAQNLNTDTGRRMYATLIGLSEAFGTITDAAEQASVTLTDQAAQISQSMVQASKSVQDEIKRLRGPAADASTTSAAELRAKFAVSTAQARAGDAAALQSLPELSKALESAAQASATSTADGVRLRAWLAGSLSETLKALGVEVPAFAAGGLHAGGLAIVGEQGPELAALGPARIYSARQTEQMLGGAAAASPDLLAELQALRAEVVALRAQVSAGQGDTVDIGLQLAGFARQTASATGKALDVLQRVVDGDDAVRTLAT
jgi:phage-related minor tail protein